MELDNLEPGTALAQAREAVNAADYPTALTLYEWFFDHALDNDSAAYYGVRLSYCLDEWHRLGQVYEPARIQLEKKFHDSLAELRRTRNPSRFHDYVSIARYTGQDDLTIEAFLDFHNADRALAKEILPFIWSTLVDSDHIQILGAYLGNPEVIYEAKLQKLDATLQLSEANPSLGGPEFSAQIRDWYRRDVSQLIKVLRAVHRDDEAEAIALRATADSAQRGVGSMDFLA